MNINKAYFYTSFLLYSLLFTACNEDTTPTAVAGETHVADTPPTLELTYEKVQKTNEVIVLFVDAKDDGQITSYHWKDEKGKDLGDKALLKLLPPHSVGNHTFSISVSDDGNHTVSKSLNIKIEDDNSTRPDPSNPNDGLVGTSEEDKRMYHILNRFSYGPNLETIADVKAKGGIDNWLKDQLFNTQETYPAKGTDIAQDMMDNFKEQYYRSNRLFPIARPIYSKHQTQAVVGTFWYNHFNTSSVNMIEESEDNDKYYFNGLGDFRKLLGICAKSSAMSAYLDGKRNIKGRLNENYAREIMELHTMGIESYNKPNGYTQADITALSRIFTGWSLREAMGINNLYRYHWKKDNKDFFRNHKFTFYQANHDTGNKIFLDKTYTSNGMQEGEDALDALVNNAYTASFICEKLAQ